LEHELLPLGMLRDWASNLYRAVVVAMVAVRVMEPAIDQIVDMVAVRHCLVSTTWTMLVLAVVLRLRSELLATIRVRFANGENMLLDLFALLVTQMTVVQVVDVAVVFNRRVTATRAVGMGVLRHDNLRW
jgi:hypothetical protein